MDKVFLRLRELAIEFPDGTVFEINRLEPVKEGWVVRLKDAVDFEGEVGMMKALVIAKHTSKTVAGSKDGDVELWDVVEIFEDEDEATEAAIQNEQMTIYEIRSGTLKWLE